MKKAMQNFQIPQNSLNSQPRSTQVGVLNDLAKIEDANLSMIGGAPETEPVFVYDDGTNLVAGSEMDCLRWCVAQSGMDLADPEMQPEDDPDYPGQWVVRIFSHGMDAGVLCQGDTTEEALIAQTSMLRNLSGGLVLSLKGWAEMQGVFSDLDLGAEGRPTQKAKVVRKPPFVSVRTVVLQPLPMTPDVAAQRRQRAPYKVRRSVMADKLDQPSGLLAPADSEISMSVQVVEDEGELYANHHDLLAAVRMGLDISGIRSWPNDAAHRFLLGRELQRSMKLRGYLEVRDFDPATIFAIDRPKIEKETADDLAGSGRQREMNSAEILALKPTWPPKDMKQVKVVMVLDAARLAMEIEPEWELPRIQVRDVHSHCGSFWVAIHAHKPQKKAASRA